MYACKDMQARALLQTPGTQAEDGQPQQGGSKPGWGLGRLGNKQEEELQCPRREVIQLHFENISFMANGASTSVA